MRALIVLALAGLPMACAEITHRGIEIPREDALSTAEAQRFLLVAGYDAGPVDGIAGPRTEAALAAFAADSGHPGGALTPELSHDLRRRALLGDGSEGLGDSLAAMAAATRFSSVRGAQERLAALGYAPGPVDGILGPRTARALRAFQTDRSLAVTGTLTPETAAALGEGG